MAIQVSIINGKAPSGGTGGVTDADLSHIGVDFLSPGVRLADDAKVEQQLTPAMSVKVAPGIVYVPSADGTMLYRVKITTTTNLAIANNAAGNPRKSAVVLKIDKATTPNNVADNVATLVEVQGTAAASPTAPNDSAIQTAVGAGNPFYRLANVDVANGAVSISNANIASTRSRVGLVINGETYQLPATDGTAGQALVTDGNNNLSFSSVAQAFVGCRLTRSSSKSFGNGSSAMVDWDTETFDTSSMHHTSTNNSRITIPTTGKYLVDAHLVFAANTTGARECQLYKNGSAIEGAYWSATGNSGVAAFVGGTIVLDLTAGDYLEAEGWQNSGGSLNMQGNGDRRASSFSAVKID